MKISNNKKRPESLLSAVWSSILWKGLDRLSSLLKHILIASAFGLSAELDVFYMATGFLGVLVFSWSRIVDVLAVPNLIEYDRSGNTRQYQALAGGLFVLCLLFSVAMSLAIYLSWDFLSGLAMGFDAARMALLKSSIAWLIPLVMFYVPMRFLASLFRSKRRFSFVYQSEFLISLIILLCVAMYSGSPAVLLWSYSFGVVVAFLFLLIPACAHFRPWANPWSVEIRSLMPMLPGLLILYGAQYVYLLTNRQFVSFLAEGSVAAVAYAWTLITLVPVLLNLEGAFITVYAEDKGEREVVDRKINDLISMAITTAIPISVVMFCFSGELMGLLLERGMFTKTNTAMVAEAVSWFSLSILPFYLINPLEQIFRVERRINYIVRRILAGLLLNVVFCGIFVFGYDLGIRGVALATTVSHWGMLGAAILGIQRFGVVIHLKRHTRWVIIMLGVSLASLLFPWLLNRLNDNHWMVIPKLMLMGLILVTVIYQFSNREGELIRTLIARSLNRAGFQR